MSLPCDKRKRYRDCCVQRSFVYLLCSCVYVGQVELTQLGHDMSLHLLNGGRCVCTKSAHPH